MVMVLRGRPAHRQSERGRDHPRCLVLPRSKPQYCRILTAWTNLSRKLSHYNGTSAEPMAIMLTDR